MYDILQLNDMLVPELLDIAEQLSIANAKKLDKQELIYKILDKQAIENSAETKGTEEKGKRKRVVKTTTAGAPKRIPGSTTGKLVLLLAIKAANLSKPLV